MFSDIWRNVRWAPNHLSIVYLSPVLGWLMGHHPQGPTLDSDLNPGVVPEWEDAQLSVQANPSLQIRTLKPFWILA